MIELIRAVMWPLAFVVAVLVVHRALTKWLAESLLDSKRACQLGEESLALAKEAVEAAQQSRELARAAYDKAAHTDETMETLRAAIDALDNRTKPVPQGRQSGLKYLP